MKKIALIIVLGVISTIVQLIDGLPWWTFLIAVLLIGALLGRKEWTKSSFLIGFFAGLLSWGIAMIYYQFSYSGDILGKVSELFGITTFLYILASALVGGILTGLAFYTGRIMNNTKEQSAFKL